MRPRLLSSLRKMPTSQTPHLTLPTSRHHPLLLYGTAWKKESTTPLVTTALSAGFQGIDTACQPRHYREDLVGAALRPYLSSHPRESLYLQTKFTPPGGQDASSCPYPVAASTEDQVRASITKSLENLGVEYIDAVLLHSPLDTFPSTLAAWRVLEGFVEQGKILHLGISNVQRPLLDRLFSESTVKPSIVQNRFYPGNAWDREGRAFCREHGIVWQSFWTLTGNPGLVASGVVERVAGRVLGDKKMREEALYLLVLALGRGWERGGVAVLDGTTREEGMKGDLEAVRKVGEVSKEELSEFRVLIRDV